MPKLKNDRAKELASAMVTAQAELTEFDSREEPLSIGFESWGEGVAVLAALQLACKHPQYGGVAKAQTVKFAKRLQALLSVTPSISLICESGWLGVENEDETE